MKNSKLVRRRLVRCTAALAACVAASTPAGAGVEPEAKTVCTITVNSSDEKESLERHLPRDRYRILELVQHGRSDWLESACQRGVSCDALVISGHFDDGTEFYPGGVDRREFLTVHELQRASCSTSCSGLFAHLKEVYLFGCNTLNAQPRYLAAAEIRRSFVRAGHSQADAERLAELLSDHYGQSNRDRLRHVFKDVPVLYGFSSMAPLGRSAGPLLERYFQSAPPGEVASGVTSPTLLRLFGPSSMVAVSGLTDADPNASLRQEVCGFAADSRSDAQRASFLHEVLRRDVAEVRMFLDDLEYYVASITAAEPRHPDVAAALAAIEHDLEARGRYLEFARDADEASVQLRMMALAVKLGWLSPAGERDEFVRMIEDRMARGALGRNEVDLVCAAAEARGSGLAGRLVASGAAQPGNVAHAAVLACLGDAEAHEQTVRALTGARDEDAEIAQVYLRHRSLAGVGEVRALTSRIVRMGAGSAQLRALDTLATQRLSDPDSLREIAGLFVSARSLELQRAIADVLIRSDYRALASPEVAISLRQHRLRSADGGTDIIDVLLRLLQSG